MLLKVTVKGATHELVIEALKSLTVNGEYGPPTPTAYQAFVVDATSGEQPPYKSTAD